MIDINVKTLISVAVAGVLTLPVTPAFAQHSGLSGLSKAFWIDYGAAQKEVDKLKSAEPLLALRKRYTEGNERTELDLSIGLVYGQRSGVVNPAKAVEYFTATLEHDLPEKTRIAVLMWRGNSQEQLNKFHDALEDYLRGLLACTYYDTTAGWPEILSPKVPIYMNSEDPKNHQRVQDYNQYRRQVDMTRSVLMQQYFFVECAKRVWKEAAVTDSDMAKLLEGLSPDDSRFKRIVDLLKSENKRPWP